MNTTKIIKGVVNSGRYTVTAPIVKEDYGLYLQIEGVELPSTYEVDFSNSEHSGTSVTMIGNSDGVLIPHQFIDTGKDIFAFLYHVGADYGRTVYKFRIPNKVRPDRTDEQPTPEEQSVIDQAISALNNAIEATEQNVSASATNAQNALNSAFSASADADRAEQAKEDASTFAQRSANSAQESADYSESAQASATASAQSASQSAQIKSDVEDLVDDAQGYAESASQSASASAQSASDAQGHANSASASAQSASGYASNAQTSAQTASAKAQDASTSAQTASTKATESAQSASQALTYKTDAETAKTASQTAQGLAESARDSAQGYASDAQGYAEDAQASAESVSASASQIAKNTSDIASLEEDRYKPYVTDSASGSIASFPDGADDIPLKSLVVDIDPVQDTSSGDPSPENICPISGWTGMQLRRDGKNLFPHESVTTYTWGFSQNYALTSAKNPVFIKANTEYTLTLGGGIKIYRMRFWDINGNVISPRGIVTVTSGTSTGLVYYDTYKFAGYSNASASTNISTITSTKDVWFDFVTENTVATNTILEVGSAPTEYEPYNGRTITIDLGQTVFGAKLDVLSGVITLLNYHLTPDNATLIRYGIDSQSNLPYAYFSFSPKASSVGLMERTLCSMYKAGSASRVDKALRMWTSEADIWDSDLDVTSLDTVKAYFADLVIVYPLATPIEIQLDAHTLNSLYGQNNIFADTGDTEVEYRADTKLYIEKLTQPEEDDMVANSAIASGQFFMIGNSLYKALTAIASGATITVGTNAQRVSLADALNLVNA